MTEIEGLRLRITGNASGLTAAIDAAKARLTQFGQSVRSQASAAAEAMKTQLTGGGAAAAPIAKPSTDQFAAFRSSSKAAADSLNSLKVTAQQTESTLSQMSLGGLVGKLTAIVGAASLVRSSINFASGAEQTAVSMKVLLGSADKAKAMIGELRALAAATPLELKGLTENAKLMLNFGVAAGDVVKNLRMLGDITGGNSEKMYLLSLAFSQSSAAGRLMGQDLLQMINAGFNPLQEISQRTGLTMVELKKRMEDGKISFAAVREAFSSATSAGGRFNGMLDEQAKTFAGQTGKMRDAFQMLLTKIGTQFLPILAAAAATATGVMAAFNGLGDAGAQGYIKMAAFVGTFAAVVSLAPRIVTGFQAIAKAMATMQALSGPKGLITLAAGLAAAAAVTVSLDRAFASQNQALRDNSAAVAQSTSAKQANADAQNRINDALTESINLQKQLGTVELAKLNTQKADLAAKIAAAQETLNVASAIANPLNIPNASGSAEDLADRARKRQIANQWEKDAQANLAALRSELGKLDSALANNANSWADLAKATKDAFKLPIDKLREDLQSLAEQVKQGGLSMSIFEQAAAKAVEDYKTQTNNSVAAGQQTQFAGIVAGSQADVQTVFRFQNQVSQFGQNTPQDQGNELLREIRDQIIKNGAAATQTAVI